MGRPATIVLFLMLGEQDNAAELTAVLWTALHEVDTFYNHAGKRARFVRYLAAGSAAPPVSGADRQWLDDRGVTFLEGVRNMARAGRRQTFETKRIISATRELAGAEALGKNRHLVAITDLELTPPPQWRYLISDGAAGDSVISIAPIDPRYWREREADRVGIIKHRVRTACLAVVGETLGLKECDNEKCIMFGNVDSVTRLDTMVLLGPEHNIEGLIEQGFSAKPSNPLESQWLMANPPSLDEVL